MQEDIKLVLRLFTLTEPKKTSERSHIFRRTSTPTEIVASGTNQAVNEHDQSLSECDKSLDTHDTKHDDCESELADLNTSQETSTIVNIVGDMSPEGTLQDSKSPSKHSPSKYSYGSTLFGKNTRSNERGGARSGYKGSDYRPADRSAESVSGLGYDERPDSRHSSVSNFSFSQPVSYRAFLHCSHTNYSLVGYSFWLWHWLLLLLVIDSLHYSLTNLIVIGYSLRFFASLTPRSYVMLRGVGRHCSYRYLVVAR